MQVQCVSAATYSLEQLAAIFTRSFEGYFYPLTTTAEILAVRVRCEQIDLVRSLVLTVAGVPAGIALLALRDDRAWCAGFGIMVAQRGQGLARQLIAELVAQARAAKAAHFSLEVLTRNEPAIKAYVGAGMTITRDLHVFEWNASKPHQAQFNPEQGRLTVVEPYDLLHHFARLHAVKPAWQYDLPALLIKPNLQGVALIEDGAVCAYVLCAERADEAIIQDVAAANAQDVVPLLRYLQSHYTKLVRVNEPANSPLAEAFFSTGFVETDRQHDLELSEVF